MKVLVDVNTIVEWQNSKARYQADFFSDRILRVARYGMERGDTRAACGDVANGFSLDIDWNLLASGDYPRPSWIPSDTELVGMNHVVRVYADGIEIGKSLVKVQKNAADDVPSAGVTVTAANPLSVAEGGTNTYTVVLDSRPTADVTITPASGDDGAATVNPASHTFTPANWSTTQSFTVSGVSDDDAEDESVRVSHRATSDDAKYDGLAVGSVTVAVTDNDTAGVTVTAANPLAVAEDGSNTYTVVLDSQPTHAVTITPASGDDGAATVSPASYTFTPANWSTAQSFTVSGVSDDDAEDESVRVSHRATSDDAKYDGLAVGSVAVAVTDDDTPQPETATPRRPGTATRVARRKSRRGKTRPWN